MGTVSLKPGWNWISYLSQGTLSLSEAFVYLTPEDGDMVKNQNGFSIYNAASGTWSGSLKSLSPGKGYVYLSNHDNAIQLVYPSSASKRE